MDLTRMSKTMSDSAAWASWYLDLLTDGPPQQPLHLVAGGGASFQAGQGDGFGDALEGR